MKLRKLNTTSGVEPIMTTLEKELDRSRQLETWLDRIEAIKLEIRLQKSEHKEVDPNLYNEMKAIRSARKSFEKEYPDHQSAPQVMVARCPYCSRETWMWVNFFRLNSQYWHLISGTGVDDVAEDAQCPHLFCVDGALNLNGHQPSEVQYKKADNTSDRIWMAAEVPFVKPRVLNLPTMVAVVHHFPIAEKYTGYPIVYFAEHQPQLNDFCLPWARIEFEKTTSTNSGHSFISGTRLDVQDYELEKWVRRGKLFWLDPDNEVHPLMRGPVEAFPYYNIKGRRHPYTIKDGQIENLPNPTKDSEPQMRMSMMSQRLEIL